MSAKTNPRPEFMSRLTALCRNLDSEVKTLELEARGALLQTKTRSNLAADKLHDEVLQLKSGLGKTLSEVKEQNINLASFLTEMTQEVEVMVTRTAKMEEFMTRYGYQPAARMDVNKMLDWNLVEPTNTSTSNIAPPAAAEFEETEEKPSDLKPELLPASPCIYDIGLSKFGLNAVLGKKEPAEDSQTQKDGDSSPRTECQNKFSFPIIQDEDPDCSIELRLNTRPLVGSLDMSGVDITPGLGRRSKKCEVKPQETPEFPLLQSDASHLLPAVSPKERVTRVLQEESLTFTPEMPELQTISLRQLMGRGRQAEEGHASPDTPDLTTTTLLHQQLQLEASSSLTPQQMEVRRLYTLSGIDISNDKFQALWELVTLGVPTHNIIKLLKEASKNNRSVH